MPTRRPVRPVSIYGGADHGGADRSQRAALGPSGEEVRRRSCDDDRDVSGVGSAAFQAGTIAPAVRSVRLQADRDLASLTALTRSARRTSRSTSSSFLMYRQPLPVVCLPSFDMIVLS